jgi:hypothetical protein
MRLELNDRGATATTVSPMAIALPPFDGLAASALAGDAIYYVANSAAGDSAKETLIMRTPLDSGTEIEAPEMRQFQQQIKEKQEH